jgi:PPOX class probable F420-dependent enzyme
VTVDLDDARAFLREHHRAVLATRRADGGVQQSPVLVNVDGGGRLIISSREGAYKVRNLRRDPNAQVCAFTDRFYGQWLFAEGRAEVVSLPEALEPLIDYYKRFPDENPDWDDYRERMERERRVLIRIELERAGPDRQG